MKILLIDNGTKHLGKLKELLNGNEIHIFKLFSKYPNFNLYDLVVLSGGSQLSIISAPEIFKQEIDLIKKTTTPIIGICQGSEIIAHAFNSELIYLEHKIKGIKEIEFVNYKFKFNKDTRVYEAHHFAIKKLGNELIELGRSRDGVEIFRHKNNKIYGIQFHPEMMVDETSGDEIFSKIISMI